MEQINQNSEPIEAGEKTLQGLSMKSEGFVGAVRVSSPAKGQQLAGFLIRNLRDEVELVSKEENTRQRHKNFTFLDRLRHAWESFSTKSMSFQTTEIFMGMECYGEKTSKLTIRSETVRRFSFHLEKGWVENPNEMVAKVKPQKKISEKVGKSKPNSSEGVPSGGGVGASAETIIVYGAESSLVRGPVPVQYDHPLPVKAKVSDKKLSAEEAAEML